MSDEPILTHLLAEAWAAKGPKPTALGTPLRYSSAMGCARQMGYAGLSAVPTDPMGPADSWAAGIGTLLHEAAQHEIGRVYESAEFEVASKLGQYISGSCDCLVDSYEILNLTGVTLGGTHVLWEFKSMGEYPWDLQMGYNRRSRTIKSGSGPKVEAITQAGLNALGIEETYPGRRIETILMGSVTPAQLSINVAKAMGVEGFARYGAEFRVSRETWEPLALDELSRMNGIGSTPEFLPDRTTPSSFLNPRGDKDWQCDYCPYRRLCISDGEGEVAVAQSWLTVREDEDA